ncbi:hypothetical protein MYOV011v1_p0208 [Vibrio phage 6E35.1a]|nr:hypothetical protein MYOV011v1_p0208 [Vibrio phage 6E35.1a]
MYLKNPERSERMDEAEKFRIILVVLGVLVKLGILVLLV